MNEVKACPFCGHATTGTKTESVGKQHHVAVRCSKCGSVGPVAIGPTRKEATKAAIGLWNAARR